MSETVRDIVHRVTMTDDRTLRLITNLATKDYYEDEWYKIENQLNNHKYEDILVLEASYNYSSSVLLGLISYFMKRGYIIDINHISDYNGIFILRKRVINDANE